jgi:hypothetical protein
VNSNIAQYYPYLAGVHNLNGGSSQSDRLAGEATPLLPLREALMMIVLLSLGLWSVVWIMTS